MNLIAFLKTLGPFTALTPGGLAGILRVVEQKDYTDGARIIARGEPGDAMYIVATGEARVPIVDSSGKERMVAKLATGSFFGEMSLITGEPRAADVFAVGPTKVLRIAKDAFFELVKSLPSLSRFLTEIVVARLAQSDVLASKLVGKYKLLDQLGRGETSIVYNAMNTVTNKQVAVKMLSHRLALDEEFRSSFQRDLPVICDLDHENIARVHEVVPAFATYFIATDFASGMPASKRIDASGFFEDDETRGVVIQLCRALGAAHQQGVFHRNLTPAKVMIDESRRAKVVDFGLAATQKPGSAAPTADADVIGTPEYMSPEQLRGAAYDRRSDIYSLGVTAYALATGEVPPIMGNPFDPRGKHMTEPFPSPRQKRRDIADDLAAFIERATQKDPGKRFLSMEEAIRALSKGDGESTRIANLRGYQVTILCRPAESKRVEDAIEEMRRALEEDANIHFGTSQMTLK